MVLVDDASLEACRDDDFVINCVHCDGVKGGSSDSTLVGWATNVVLNHVVAILL